MFKFNLVLYKDILNISNLHIKEKTITSIIGASGTGKTTLLKLMNKMISPTQGSIHYHDVPLCTINSITHRRQVLMLPQSPAIYEGTVEDNLQIGLRFSKKTPAKQARLLDILKSINLNIELSKNVSVLSGGERQRLALGRLLLMEPEVMLLDEPSSSLDEVTEKEVIETLIKYIKDHNKSLIMVTHSNKIAKKYSDEIIQINQDHTFKKIEVSHE